MEECHPSTYFSTGGWHLRLLERRPSPLAGPQLRRRFPERSQRSAFSGSPAAGPPSRAEARASWSMASRSGGVQSLRSVGGRHTPAPGRIKSLQRVRRRAADGWLEHSRLASPSQLPHQQSKVKPGYVNQEALQDVLVMSQVRSAQPACLVTMGKTALDPLST